MSELPHFRIWWQNEERLWDVYSGIWREGDGGLFYMGWKEGKNADRSCQEEGKGTYTVKSSSAFTVC